MAPYRSPLASPAETKMVGVGIDCLILERIHHVSLLEWAKQCFTRNFPQSFPHH
jgi:hypothetical protein